MTIIAVQKLHYMGYCTIILYTLHMHKDTLVYIYNIKRYIYSDNTQSCLSLLQGEKWENYELGFKNTSVKLQEPGCAYLVKVMLFTL